MSHKQHGFSLIEIMIVVAILGVLAAIAIPAYDSYITRTKRSDAKTALTELAQLQESFYADNNRYSSNLTGNSSLRADKYGFKIVGGKTMSKEGHYEITLSNASVRNFTLTARPVNAQLAGENRLSKKCTAFTIDASGKKTSTPTGSECW